MPLTVPASDAARLTAVYRASEARAAAEVAAYIALYYRTRVDPNSQGSIAAWLEIAVRRILAGHNLSSRRGAMFATALRRLELPGAVPLTFTPKTLLNEDQIRTSLAVVGPQPYLDKARELERTDLKDHVKQAHLAKAKQAAETKIAGVALRQVQNGGRQTTYAAATTDRVALGYVRVTRDKPCYFCALLAGRGLQEGYTYTEDSFELSDARFTGEGTAKVHDNCQCHLKPVYVTDDDYVERSEFFEALYRELYGGSLAEFRRNYEDWVAGRITVDV